MFGDIVEINDCGDESNLCFSRLGVDGDVLLLIMEPLWWYEDFSLLLPWMYFVFV